MTHYRGNRQDQARIQSIQQEREQQALAYAHEINRIKNIQHQSSNVNTINTIHDIFHTVPSNTYDDLLKQSNIGLVTADEYKRKNQLINQLKNNDQIEEIKRKEREAKRLEVVQQRKKQISVLSFGDDIEEDDEDEKNNVTAANDDDDTEKKNDAINDEKRSSNGTNNNHANDDTNDTTHPPSSKRIKLLNKNPTVNTSFLPDRDREEQEEKLKKQLHEKWLKEQQTIKDEKLLIEFSYWDGAGHRGKVECKKGNTIGEFLERVRIHMKNKYRELQSVNAETGMMYVKEDMIIPTHFTFYDLIVTKAKGKTGPLYQFGNVEDVRMLADATVEKKESHAGKVMTQIFYDRHKHIFPYTRYEIYDPAKQYKYQDSGGEKEKEKK